MQAIYDYTLAHEVQEREDNALKRAETDYVFKELFSADRFDCPVLSDIPLTDVQVLSGGLS